MLCRLLPLAAAVLVLGWGHSSAHTAEAAETAAVELHIVSLLGTCNDVKCDVPANGTFELHYVLTALPSGGFIAFQSEIDYGALVANGGSYQPTAQAADEIVWPDGCTGFRVPGAPTGNEGLINHADSTGCVTFPKSNAGGVLVSLTFNCSDVQTSSLIDLVPYSGANLDASAIGAFPPGSKNISVSDTIEVNCIPSVGGVAELPNSTESQLAGEGPPDPSTERPRVAAITVLVACSVLLLMRRYAQRL